MTNDAAEPTLELTEALRNDFVEASRMSFGDHLDELRSCLIRALVGVGLCSIASFLFGKQILAFICRPLLYVQHVNGLEPHLQVLAPTGAFTSYLRIAFFSGLIVAMPWVLYQAWRFIVSGLYPKERKFVRVLVPASLGLFILGVLFLYFVVLPIVLHFFIRFNRSFAPPELAPTLVQRWLLPSPPEVQPTSALPERPRVPILPDDPANPQTGEMWVNGPARRFMVQTDSGVLSMPLAPGPSAPPMYSEFAIDFYVSFVLMLALAFGLAFETPIAVFFLVWSGLLTTDAMRRGRRYVILGTVIVAAVLTPPDVVSQLLLAFPMYLLFELGLWATRLLGSSPKAA